MDKGSEVSKIKSLINWLKTKRENIINPRFLITYYKQDSCKTVSDAKNLLNKLRDYGLGIWGRDRKTFILFDNS